MPHNETCDLVIKVVTGFALLLSLPHVPNYLTTLQAVALVCLAASTIICTQVKAGFVSLLAPCKSQAKITKQYEAPQRHTSCHSVAENTLLAVFSPSDTDLYTPLNKEPYFVFHVLFRIKKSTYANVRPSLLRN